MNEWMNEWGIYIALYCVLLYTQSALQSYEGVSLQPPPVCSIHFDIQLITTFLLDLTNATWGLIILPINFVFILHAWFLPRTEKK